MFANLHPCLSAARRGTLSDAIARGAVAKANPDGAPIPGTVDLRAVLATAREIAGAMQYLHEQVCAVWVWMSGSHTSTASKVRQVIGFDPTYT